MAVILRCSVSLELERRQERPEKGGSPIYRLDHGHRDGHGMVGNLDGLSLRLIFFVHSHGDCELWKCGNNILYFIFQYPYCPDLLRPYRCLPAPDPTTALNRSTSQITALILFLRDTANKVLM